MCWTILLLGWCVVCVRVYVYVDGGEGGRERGRGEEKEEMISECPRAMKNRKNACQRVFRGRIKDKNCTLFEIKFMKCWIKKKHSEYGLIWTILYDHWRDLSTDHHIRILRTYLVLSCKYWPPNKSKTHKTNMWNSRSILILAVHYVRACCTYSEAFSKSDAFWSRAWKASVTLTMLTSNYKNI